MPRLSARETRHLGQISLDIPLVAFALGPRQIPAQRSTTVARAAPPTDVLQRLLPRLQPAPAQAVPRLMPRAAAAVTRSLRTRVARVSVSCTQITRPQLWWILAVPRHVPHEPTLEAQNTARARLVKRLVIKIPSRPGHLPVFQRFRVAHIVLIRHQNDAHRHSPAIRVETLRRRGQRKRRVPPPRRARLPALAPRRLHGRRPVSIRPCACFTPLLHLLHLLLHLHLLHLLLHLLLRRGDEVQSDGRAGCTTGQTTLHVAQVVVQGVLA